MNDREQRIREWAYRLWEQDGYAHGRDSEHWYRAVEIVLQEDAAPEAGIETRPEPEVEAAAADLEAAPKPSRTKAKASAPATEPVTAAPKPARAKASKAKPAEPPVVVAPEPAPVAPVPAGRRKRS